MGDIEYTFKQNNAILIVRTITQLIEAVKVKKSLQNNGTGKYSSDLDIAELQLLKSKCGDENGTICITASQGIVSLVEEGVLPVGSTLSDLILNLLIAKRYSGITMAIGNLLLIDMQRSLDKKTYRCPFNLHKLQHPMITILSQNSDIWFEVYCQMQMFLHHSYDNIASNSIELLRPVFFYILCNPVSKLCVTFRRHTWNLLITREQHDAKLLSFEILSWSQINSKQNCLDLCDYLTEFSKITKSNNSEIYSTIVLFLCSLLHKLIEEGYDPSPYVKTMIDILEISGTENTHSVMLVMLSKTITICSSLYLKEVLRLCKVVIFKQSSNDLSVKMLISSLLQWLLYPSNLLKDSLKIASDIITFTEKNNFKCTTTAILLRNDYFKFVKLSNLCIDEATLLCCLAEKWQMDNKQVSNWLDNLLKYPNMMLPKIFIFISSIFISGFEPNVRKNALKVLLKIVDSFKEYSSKLLVLILFKLANEKDPEIQVDLLKAIPLMATLRENIPLILTTLETIRKEKGCLKTLSFNLYMQLFLTEIRSFPYLQKLLLEPEPQNDWEFTIAKVQTLKEICMKRPNLYGKEMVGHLSQILNKHIDINGSMASAIAIDGITVLCESGIVDISSTWRSLAPRFSKDKRPLVLKSLCNFFSGVADLRVTSKEHEDLVSEVQKMLWQYVSYCEDIEVVSAAFNALSDFNVEEMQLKHLPDLYRQNLKLPSSFAKTPEDAARKPEDVLPYIPGECWVQMLQKINQDVMEDAGNMLINWIRIEIAGYKGGVYIVADGKTEPVNYSYLPAKSIVRGIGNILQLMVSGYANIHLANYVIQECLRILSQPYSKPLPPLNWCFLHDLFHNGVEIRCLCIDLACKQIQLSGSALRLLENYLATFEPTTEKRAEILVLFSNLSYLCKGVAPNMLRPVISGSLQVGYEMATRKKDLADFSLLLDLSNDVKNVMLAEDIHEANRILIGQIIETFCEQLDDNLEIFDIFLDVTVELPSKYVERISSPSLWWEITKNKIERAVKVRCLLSTKAEKAPFVWLNECINIASTLPSVQTYLLRHIVGVFCVHRKHLDTSDWLLELMGQIQEKLTNENKDNGQIVYMCDIFLVAVIVLAGHECFVSPVDQIIISNEERLSLFPGSLLDLVNHSCHPIIVQIMEWLFHMSSCADIPLMHRSTFYQSLIALRHEKAFIESARWMKYMSLKYLTSN